MKTPIAIKVNVLLVEEGNYWVAQGLEYDIAAQGKTVDEAKERFRKTFTGQICLNLMDNKTPLHGVTEAPKNYWDMAEGLERTQMPAEDYQRFALEAEPGKLRLCAA